MNLKDIKIHNSKYFDEKRTPRNPINELRRISYEPELFEKINSESEKADIGTITTLTEVGIMLTGAMTILKIGWDKYFTEFHTNLPYQILSDFYQNIPHNILDLLKP